MLPCPTWLTCVAVPDFHSQLGLSTCPEFRCRVAGGRFQAGGTVSMAGFRRPVVRRGEAESRTGTHYSNYHYMASFCFGQAIRHHCLCCHRGMAAVIGIFLAISIHRIKGLHVPHREDGCRSGTPSPVISLHGFACHDIRTVHVTVNPCGVPIKPQVCWALGLEY
jgi:hypothetical protein